MDIDVKDPKVVRWLIAALVILVVVPIYFMTTLVSFTYVARKGEIAQLEERHQKLSRDLEKARLLVRNLERVEREYEILNQQWQVAQTLLPEVNEMPNLLRKVTAAGQQSGIEFELFKPQATVPQGFYNDNPVSVKIEGGYHQTGVFLSRLANLNRIVNVSNLRLKELPDQTEQPFTVETEMTLTAYTLGPAGAAAEPTGDNKQLATKSTQQTQERRPQPTAAKTAATH